MNTRTRRETEVLHFAKQSEANARELYETAERENAPEQKLFYLLIAHEQAAQAVAFYIAVNKPDRRMYSNAARMRKLQESTENQIKAICKASKTTTGGKRNKTK